MCCLILDLGLVIMGIVALVKGEIMLTRKRVVRRGAAQLIGGLLAGPVVLGVGLIVVGFAIDMVQGGQGEGPWLVAGAVAHIVMVVVGLLASVVIAIVKHDRPGALPEMPLYPGFAPPVNAPPPDPNNPYASPFGGDFRPPPG